MSELLQKNRDGELTEQEQVELDALGREFDAATLRKGRALSILAQLDCSSQLANRRRRVHLQSSAR
jgi:hypothetical protein